MNRMKTARDIAGLRNGRNDWYKIQNLSAGGAEVMIYDEVGYFGVTAQDFLNDLAGVAGPITLRLNSPGGEVFDGIAIYNALRARGGVAVYIDGLAASIASVIAMAADPGKLAIARRATMMIHDGFSQAIGNAADMRELADLLDQQSDNIAGIYADRTGKPAAYWRGLMQGEKWYTGEQAVAEGLADLVVDTAPATNSWDLSVFRHAPGRETVTVAAAATVTVNADGTHEPMTGTHTHAHSSFGKDGDTAKSMQHTHDGDANHSSASRGEGSADGSGGSGGKGDMGNNAANAIKRAKACPSCAATTVPRAMFCASCGVRLLMAAEDNGWVQDPDGAWRFDPDGDGDDDSTPEGDTDHDYFDADGKPIPGKEIPPCPGAVRDVFQQHLRNANVDNSQWDADKAWHNGATSDDPAAFYKGICAGRRSGDPSKQSSWALPYKYHPGDAPNANGVRAALARLSSTQGLTNEDEARSKLEGLMKTINPDYEKQSDLDTRLLRAVFAAGLESGNTTALEGSNR